MSYIDRLIKSCEAAKKAAPIKEFDLKDSSELYGITKAIYVIEQVGGGIEQTFLAFSRYKDKKERKCARLNAPSVTMYVGSSTTDVRKRIEEHLGQGYDGTYALHLKHWFCGSYKITVKEYDEPKDVLQIIEDDLSDKLKPAFGKPGSNNK